MNSRLNQYSFVIALSLVSSLAIASDEHGAAVAAEAYTPGKTLTQSVQASFTPDKALDTLKEGNKRFISGKPLRRDNKLNITRTALGQFPYASVLACIDSRVPPEVVFDQSIGDIFTARVAGNIVNDDILGSLEYAAVHGGSRVIVVLGHTACGAVKAACDGLVEGNITQLLEKIKPSVATSKVPGDRNSKNHAFVSDVTELNVKDAIQTIRLKSPVLKDLESQGKIKIVGAIYDTSNGKITWQ